MTSLIKGQEPFRHQVCGRGFLQEKVSWFTVRRSISGDRNAHRRFQIADAILPAVSGFKLSKARKQGAPGKLVRPARRGLTVQG